MLPTLRRSFAAAAASSALKPSMNLLPPIPLYRRLLRAHRKHLPAEMRLLGDEYVKAEFRAHRDVENPVHLVSLDRIDAASSWIGANGRSSGTSVGGLFDRMATIRPENRGRRLGRREIGPVQDRENERSVSPLACPD